MRFTSLLLFSFASLAASETDYDISWFPQGWPEPGRFLWGGEWSAGEFVHDVLYDRETPVAVFYPMNWHNLELTCVVLYSNWKDKLSPGEDPPIRMPEDMWTSYHRMTCIIYARIYWFAKAGSFWKARQEAIRQLEEGVGEGTLMTSTVTNAIERCFDQYSWRGADYWRTLCLRRLQRGYVDESNHLEMASFAGAVVAEYILYDMRTTQSAWNWDGSKFADGEPCVNNCAPFMDWTGYTPVNSAHEIRDPTRWQPLVESNKLGYSFVQEHVAAQLSEMDLIIGDKAMRARRAPDPKMDYNQEMKDVYERMNEFSKDNDRIAKTKIMDNKLAVLIRIMIAIDTVRPWSLESAALFLSLFVTTEHDALIMAWKEKLNWDLIRPTSVSMMMGGMWEDDDNDGVFTKNHDKNMRRRTSVTRSKQQAGAGFGGGSGTYSNGSNQPIYTNGGYKQPLQLDQANRVPWIKDLMIDPKQWTPFIRVMPHSEYPSGSMAICQAVADFTKLFLPLDNRSGPLRVNWPLEKGAAGYGLPTEDVDAWTESMDEFAEVCGQSRLWGGMHFTKAVPAAKDLVEGLGEMAYELALLILNGNELKPHENMRALKGCGKYALDECAATPHCRPNKGRCIKATCLKKDRKVVKDPKICDQLIAIGVCRAYKTGKYAKCVR